MKLKKEERKKGKKWLKGTHLLLVMGPVLQKVILGVQS